MRINCVCVFTTEHECVLYVKYVHDFYTCETTSVGEENKNKSHTPKCKSETTITVNPRLQAKGSVGIRKMERGSTNRGARRWSRSNHCGHLLLLVIQVHIQGGLSVHAETLGEPTEALKSEPCGLSLGHQAFEHVHASSCSTLRLWEKQNTLLQKGPRCEHLESCADCLREASRGKAADLGSQHRTKPLSSPGLSGCGNLSKEIPWLGSSYESPMNQKR